MTVTEKEIEDLSFVSTGYDIGWVKIYDSEHGEETAHLLVSENTGTSSTDFTVTARADNQEFSGLITVVLYCSDGVLETTLSAHIQSPTGEETIAIRELYIQW